MIRLRIHPDAAAAAHDVAAVLRSTVVASPACVLGLPTGRTPILVHAQPSSGSPGAPCRRRDHVQLDEFVGLSPMPRAASRRSCGTTLRAGRSPPGAVELLDGPISTRGRAIRARHRRRRGLNLAVLGFGTNGHIG
jgi:6-phosphogluconolactonase/glucosamine-6-phosphate isomerase/deaminase